MSEYGRVGMDVGVVGRWVRLLSGITLSAAVLWDFFGGGHGHTLRTNVLFGVFLVGIVAVYHAAYLMFAERLRGRSPWIATAIFVLPAMYFSTINAFMVPAELSFGYLVGMPFINHPMSIAWIAYIGISFVVQFASKYGGCEVIAIQNLVSKRSCTSYCVPLLPLDFAEKAIVDALARRRSARTA